jgi:hypothetical protein
MTIKLTTTKGNLFAIINNWNDANLAAKSIFKRNYYSDLCYDITFDDGEKISGSIDLEPQSFHKEHQSEIITTHLKTYWGNISNIVLPRFPFTQEDKDYFTFLLTKLAA